MSYDHYKETEELISMLKNTSLRNYAEALQSAMDDGATGTEIFMALRWNIDKLLTDSTMNDVLRAKAYRVLRELDNALS